MKNNLSEVMALASQKAEAKVPVLNLMVICHSEMVICHYLMVVCHSEFNSESSFKRRIFSDKNRK